MAKRLGQSGITLMELVIGLGLLAAVAGIVAGLTGNMSRVSSGLVERGSAESNAVALLDHVLKVGRAAGAQPNPAPRACQSTPTTLRCFIDFGRPPTGVPVEVRFRYDAAAKKAFYEQLTTAVPETWTQQSVYEQIDELVFCGDAEFNAATCPIQPPNIGARHRANLGAQAAMAAPLPPAPLPAAPASTPPNRFYRVRVRPAAGLQPDANAPASLVLQSSFFVRNPPFRNDPVAVFQHGTK